MLSSCAFMIQSALTPVIVVISYYFALSIHLIFCKCSHRRHLFYSKQRLVIEFCCCSSATHVCADSGRAVPTWWTGAHLHCHTAIKPRFLMLCPPSPSPAMVTQQCVYRADEGARLFDWDWCFKVAQTSVLWTRPVNTAQVKVLSPSSLGQDRMIVLDPFPSRFLQRCGQVPLKRCGQVPLQVLDKLQRRGSVPLTCGGVCPPPSMAENRCSCSHDCSSRANTRCILSLLAR